MVIRCGDSARTMEKTENISTIAFEIFDVVMILPETNMILATIISSDSYSFSWIALILHLVRFCKHMYHLGKKARDTCRNAYDEN